MVDLHEPTGWLLIPLKDIHDRPVRTYMVQIAVLSNHQNGRDTHMRQIKIHSPVEDRAVAVDSVGAFTSPAFKQYSCIRWCSGSNGFYRSWEFGRVILFVCVYGKYTLFCFFFLFTFLSYIMRCAELPFPSLTVIILYFWYSKYGFCKLLLYLTTKECHFSLGGLNYLSLPRIHSLCIFLTESFLFFFYSTTRYCFIFTLLWNCKNQLRNLMYSYHFLINFSKW